MADTLPDLLESFPKSWLEPNFQEELLIIDRKLQNENSRYAIFPPRDAIFTALNIEPRDVKVVIVGQDPYPTPGLAIGRAFGVPRGTKSLPGSLKNIITELKSDVGIEDIDPSLESWQSQGVLLLNRILTVRAGEPLSHAFMGWQKITEHIVARAAQSGAVGLLWGKEAAKLGSIFQGHAVIGVHPSPLSAHRGFFGSKPFSRVNSLIDQPNHW